MKKMPISVAETIEATLPDFVDLVQGRTNHAIRLRLDDFEAEPILLYHCVWYAISCGKKVTIEPSAPPDRHPPRSLSRGTIL